MAKMKKLEDLFHDTLKDVYFAEKKILASLPKMAKAAQHSGLKAAFQKHLGETEGQIDRLEQVFAEIDKKPKARPATPSWASPRKVRRSWRSTRACRLTTQACWLLRRPSSTTR